MTKAITILATWKPSHAKSIQLSTCKNDCQCSKQICSKQQRLQKSGMQAQQDVNGTKHMPKPTASVMQVLWRNNANAVVSSSPTEALASGDMFAQDTVSSNSETNPELMTLSALAHNAGSHSKPTSINQELFAVDHVLCVRAMQQKEKVYDLTVEDQHEFFANGILVHNCWDGIRYGLDGEIQRTGALGVWERLGAEA